MNMPLFRHLTPFSWSGIKERTIQILDVDAKADMVKYQVFVPGARAHHNASPVWVSGAAFRACFSESMARDLNFQTALRRQGAR